MVAKRKKRANPEHQLQSAYIQWVRILYPNIISFSIPNGAHTSITQARTLIKEGLYAGAPDTVILWPNEQYHLLFIEFKAGKNVLSPKQKAFRDYALAHNYNYVTCYDIDTAMNITKEHLKDYHNARCTPTL